MPLTRSDAGARRLRLAAVLTAVMVAVVFGLVWLERSLLFPRGFVQEDESARQTPGLEVNWVQSPAGRVEWWMLAGDDVSAERPGPAVLFFHGNGELIDHWPRMLSRYRELGISVVLPEFRGYGRSAGSPSEGAIRDDMRTVLSHVRADPRVDPDRLVFHGRSLGGGVAGQLLSTHAPAALVVESTFTSVPDVVPWASLLIVDRFDSRPRFAAYGGPMLIFHGTRDEVVPVAHAHRNHEAHGDAELVLYDCGHNDLPPAGTDYWARIERFLRQHEVTR
ncbi:MAG: alpha/beta hydrolase [Sandaracinaceae bacterium]